MKEKTKNILRIILISIVLGITLGTSCAFAADDEGEHRTPSDSQYVIKDSDKWNPGKDPDWDSGIKAKIGKIAGAIRNVGIVVLLGTTIILGIKYMTASVDGKADLKKSMIPYFIGSMLLIIGGEIVSLIYDIAGEI